jgi:uncharacterized protein YggU (UPF0235/DUF167 family)
MKSLKILVKPNKKQNRVYTREPNLFSEEEVLVVETTEPPIENRVNNKVIELIADFFGVNKSKVEIEAGYKSKFKQIIIKEK